MTIVRNITSHSERAAAIEAGLYANSLASTASSSAYLLEVLAGGTPMSSVPGLVEASQSFIRDAVNAAERKRSGGKQTFRNLIPIRVAVEVVGDPENLQSVADELGRVLEDYRTVSKTKVDTSALIKKLDNFAEDFSAHALQVPKSLHANS